MVVKYLLDSDVLISHLRGREMLREEILAEGAGVSVITVGELFFGAYKFGKGDKDIEKIRTDLDTLGIEVIELKEEMVEIFGLVKARLEKEGRRLEDFDLLIAATAMSEKLILVTDNVRHFGRIKGLKLERIQ